MRRTPAEGSPRRLELAAALALSVGAAWLQWEFRARAGGLWRDEVSSVNVAGARGASEFWRVTANNSNPVLHPVALALAGGLDERLLSDAGLRGLGLLTGLALLAALWWGAAATGAGPPLLATALLAMSPAAVVATAMVRPYGLGALATLAHFVLTWRLLRRPSGAACALAALAAVLSVHALYQTPSLVAAVGLAGAYAARRSGDRRAARLCLLALVPAAATCLPYLPILSASREWLELVSEAGPGTVVPYFLLALGGPSPSAAAPWLAGLPIGLTLAAARLASPGRDEFDPARKELAAYASAALVLSLGYFALFAVTGFSTGPWNFLPFLALAAVSLDCLAASLAAPIRRARAPLALIAGLAAFGPAWEAARAPLGNMREAALRLSERVGERDLVIVNPWFYAISFRRYYRGAAPWVTVPPIDDFTVHRYDLVRARMGEPDPMAPALTAARGVLAKGGAVWLLGTVELYEGEPPAVRPAPDPAWGWRELPYINAWSWQLGHLLRELGGTPELALAPPRRTLPSQVEWVPLLRVPARGAVPNSAPARRRSVP